VHTDQLDERCAPFFLFAHDAHLRRDCCALYRISISLAIKLSHANGLSDLDLFIHLHLQRKPLFRA
jgi:hypothetical protein